MKKILLTLLMVAFIAAPALAKDAPENQFVTELQNPNAQLDEIKLLDATTARLEIVGSIDSLESKKIWRDFQVLKHKYPKVKKIVFLLSSWGGSGFDGVGLAELLKSIQREGVVIEAHAVGKIASAAVPVFAVCKPRYATPGTVFMLHKARIFKFLADEDVDNLKKQIKSMEILRCGYMQILADNSNLTLKEVEAKIVAETWFTAQEAKAWGLVDEIK